MTNSLVKDLIAISHKWVFRLQVTSSTANFPRPPQRPLVAYGESP